MSQQTPTEGEVLLPALVPRRRPRTTSFMIHRGEPIRLDVTVFHDFLTLTSEAMRSDEQVDPPILPINQSEDLTAPGVDVQAKVFRDFRDAGSLISVKTVANQGILFSGTPGNPGRVEIQLTPEDVAEEKDIYVAIYVNGRMVDLFGNPIQPSPSNL